MGKYKFLILVFLYAAIASPIASILGINVQFLYRVPLLNIRWIDIAIITIIISYIISLLSNKRQLPDDHSIIRLCLLLLLFETYQLAKSWQVTDQETQISHFLCMLSLFIIIDLVTFKIEPYKIINFLKYLAISGAFVLIIRNLIIFYSFISGNTILVDSDIRIELDFLGKKESLYEIVIVSFVYAFGLYIINLKSHFWEKILFLTVIATIYINLIYSFARGDLITISSISLISIFLFSKTASHAFMQLLSVISLILFVYLIFGNTLHQKGYDPVEKISETIEFSYDVNNPDWDKGRSVSREYALKAWETSIWTGTGYDDLSNYGLPEDIATAHNFIITSLFHRGIIGTAIYLLIIILLFRNSIKLWPILNKKDNYQNDLMKLLVIVSFFWLIPFWTQEAIWEKHSLTMQFMYLGLISNYYKQQIAENKLSI